MLWHGGAQRKKNSVVLSTTSQPRKTLELMHLGRRSLKSRPRNKLTYPRSKKKSNKRGSKEAETSRNSSKLRKRKDSLPPKRNSTISGTNQAHKMTKKWPKCSMSTVLSLRESRQILFWNRSSSILPWRRGFRKDVNKGRRRLARKHKNSNLN